LAKAQLEDLSRFASSTLNRTYDPWIAFCEPRHSLPFVIESARPHPRRHTFLQWVRNRLAIPSDRGDTKQVVGAHSLVRERGAEIERLSVPDNLEVTISLQDLAALAKLREDFMNDFLHGLVLVNVHVVARFAVNRIEINLIL